LATVLHDPLVCQQTMLQPHGRTRGSAAREGQGRDHYQRGLTAVVRAAGQKQGDVHRMQVWAGQSAALAKAQPATDLVQQIWD
jgi:NAD(P)H-dependent flavin oxidoreductase YrpB (nitropropane dioxygenase family)